MEKKVKIFKTITVILIIIAVSLIAFVGVFRTKLNYKINLIPDYTFGMEIAGTREFKFTLDTSSEETEVYVDEDGNVKGEVIESEDEEDDDTTISLETTVDELEETDEEESEDVVAEEEVDQVSYSTETREIKANEDEVLNKESYEETKSIIQKRLEKAQIPEYNLRLDTVTGDLILEVPEDDNTDLAYDLALAQGKFEIIDSQTGVVLLDNSHIKSASALYASSDSTYQAYLEIDLNKEGTEILKEISNTYVQTTNEEDETETLYVDLQIDGSTLLTTYFGEELDGGVIQITMGSATTDYDSFLSSYEGAAYYANILDSGMTPNAYALSSDNFVQSQITDDMIMIAKIVFAIAIVIVSVVLIIKYKLSGLLGALASVGYIALTSLALRYTGVVITLNSLIAFCGMVVVNYVFIWDFLRRRKTDSTKHAFSEGLKKLNIVIVPLWVIAVIFTFMTNITIGSVGMVLFWGLFVHVIYSFLITRTLYV